MGNAYRFYADIMVLHDEVTGSCILIIIKFPNGLTKKIVVDCGLFQETEYSELNTSFPFNASDIDYVLITHNHVDHTGRIPLLFKYGYRGDVHVTNSTAKLLPSALEDSYKVLRTKAKMANMPALYGDGDVDEALKHVKGHNYEESVWLDDNIKVTFFKNGHLPGAACILMQIKNRSHEKHYEDINILFTGDYNNKNLFFDVPPIPKWVHQLPVTVIQESTYGKMDSTEIEYVFEKNVLNAIHEGKEIIIPVFSLGRAQEILFMLKMWQQQGKLDVSIPIYLEGKLMRRYNDIYLRDGLDNREECKDFMPENYTYVTDLETRRSIMHDGATKIILCTSGMGSYGPAQTYLPTYLKKPNALIHFTGYCAEGTLGRRLHDSTVGDIVEVAGLQVKKSADVQFTNELSAHAKANELIDFLRPFEHLNFVLINHGETDSKEIYAKRVLSEIAPKDDVAILGRDYFFRIDGFGYVKSLSTKFE